MLPLVLGLSLLGGCFGSFKLTTKVWEFNRDVSDNFIVQEVVFLAFVIVPVYEIATIVDAVVLNTIEVLTGDNPVAAAPPESRYAVLADGSTLAMIPEGDGLTLELDREGRRLERKLRRMANRLEVREGERLIASVDRGSDGTAILTDAQGRRVVLDHALIERAALAHAVGGNDALGLEVARILDEAPRID